MSKKLLYIIHGLFFLYSLLYIIPHKVWCFELTILHTNDVHAHLAGYKENTGKPCFTSTEPHCVGGYPKIAQALLGIRQKNPNILLLDAGDQFLGTPFYSDFINTPEKLPFIEFMNRLGYNAMSPGNHEFDHGCGVFLGAIKNLNFPVIASNLTFTNPTMLSNIHPWIIIEKEGKRIGIIGLALQATATTSNPCSEAVFSDEEQSLRHAIQEIKKHNVYTIIVLSHAGTPKDIEYATKIDGISVIIGGHTHTLLSNTHPMAVGPYPTVKKSPSGKPVLIITAKEKAGFLGCLHVTFDKHGFPQKWHGDAIYLNKPLSNDPAIVSLAHLLDHYGKPIYAKLNEKIGEICDPNDPSFDTTQTSTKVIDDVPSHFNRRYETLTGNLILNAVLTKAHELHADIALVATGLIRSSLPIGAVTKLDVNTVLPIEDPLMIGDVPGYILQEAFENSVSGVHLTVYLGKFLYVGGMRIVFDPHKPIGHRVQSIEICNSNGQYEPLDPNKTYKVVITRFAAQGNDGYTMLKNIQWKSLDVSVENVLIDYLKKNSPICVKKDGRIVNLGQKSKK